MLSLEQVVKRLKAAARPDQLESMAKYGLVKENRLGVSMPALRALAKEIGKGHQLALELWETGIQDARILAALVDKPEEVTEEQMDGWVQGINSWDVCDQVCMNLFDKTGFARKKIAEWSEREEEFVKRTAYSLIACLAWHDKQAPDSLFLEFLPIITNGATDERNFVKKAVSWALRHIGKRNLNLNRAALKAAKEIHKLNSKAARWIATNAIRELEGEAVQRKLGKK
jgi:3-methyladenine DNA glycosylase AlkD